MKALVLDFDGVVSDSAREAIEVARTALLDLHPDSPLGDRDEESLLPAFLEMMPLGNRAEDFGTALLAIERGLRFEDQADYDRFRKGRDAGWIRDYHHRFYEVRADLSRRDPERWLSLMRPYRPLLGVLRRRAGQAAYAIATAKDGASVRRLLDAYGVADLFRDDLILDKETGTSKKAHLQRVGDLLALPFPEMTFLDDKVNHLDTVAPLGVRCALATWGFNGPREYELARQRGYLTPSLDDVETVLFDGSTDRGSG